LPDERNRATLARSAFGNKPPHGYSSFPAAFLYTPEQFLELVRSHPNQHPSQGWPGFLKVANNGVLAQMQEAGHADQRPARLGQCSEFFCGESVRGLGFWPPNMVEKDAKLGAA